MTDISFVKDYNIKLELIKAGLAGTVSILTLLIGWLVGQRLTNKWNSIQKQRETEIANVQQFYAVYGEFRELSKTWRLLLPLGKTARSDIEARRWPLLSRACALESKLESINIKLASERSLKPDELSTIGLFRQEILRVRESIRDDYYVDSGKPGPEYRYFNHLASQVAVLISSEPHKPCPSASQASNQLRDITNVSENRFYECLVTYTKENDSEKAATDLSKLLRERKELRQIRKNPPAAPPRYRQSVSPTP